MAIIRKTIEEMRRAKSRTDWARVDRMIKNNKYIKADGDFEGGRLVHAGKLIPRAVGRPKKEITRQLASIRIPEPALVKLRSLGKGWSTVAGDVLADWINKKPVKRVA